ncbi:MAG: hypothetical protein IIB14_08940 [Chloroflexi bacterium]|nr:hypothetical protein [Chloroflexota bacterium]
MEGAILKSLISELLGIDDMLLVIDSGGAVAEMYARDIQSTEFSGQWSMIESGDWHMHLDLATVSAVQFVDNADHGHDMMPKVYYARLSAADGTTLVRFYFPNPWLDDSESPTEFQPERLRAFEELRDRYVGKDGITSVELPEQVAG